MVVIIAAGPGTLRIGRSTVRSTSTPRMPQNSMTATSASSSPLADQPGHLRHARGGEAPHHEDVEMREVGELDDAVDHGEPEREERVHRAQAHPVDDLLKQDINATHGLESRLVLPTLPLVPSS